MRHLHYLLSKQHARNEKRVWVVIALTASMMVGEIVAGLVFGSMALLADGWHMFTRAGALTISALAYGYARRHANDARFSFGTGKVGELAGFTSAVISALIALAIGYASVVRLGQPVPIAFDQAIAVAVLGLAVNLLSVWLLHEGSGNGHSRHAGHDHHAHDGAHPDDHHGNEHSPAGRPPARDSNLRAASGAWRPLASSTISSARPSRVCSCCRPLSHGWRREREAALVTVIPKEPLT